MRIAERLALWCYLAAMNLVVPLGLLVVLPVLLLSEKRRKTLFRRLGFQRFPQLPSGRRPLWIHALSLGETLSSVSLVRELRRRLKDQPMVFSVSTLSAMQIARKRIGPHVDGLFYFPLDFWWSSGRALKSVSPQLIVFIETDVWPGFLYRVRRAKLPAMLVNARLSPKTYRVSKRLRSLFAPALNSFCRVCPQSEAEAGRYRRVGVESARLGCCGNLKFDVANLVPDAVAIEQLRGELGLVSSNIVLLAGSTHPGEEEPVIAAYEVLRKRFLGVRLIIVPRHPTRASEVLELFGSQSTRTQLLSSLEKRKQWDVLIVDVMGVLSKLYYLAAASFVGGSLVSKGGQNPLESAAAGCPVLFGPDMSDFPDISRWMIEAGAAIQISRPSELANRWADLLSDKEILERMKEACLRMVRKRCGATACITGEVINQIEQSLAGENDEVSGGGGFKQRPCTEAYLK